jgi:hypothetical protein
MPHATRRAHTQRGFTRRPHSLRSSSAPLTTRGQRATSRDQVRRVGGLDPASQLLAPPADQSRYSIVIGPTRNSDRGDPCKTIADSAGRCNSGLEQSIAGKCIAGRPPVGSCTLMLKPLGDYPGHIFCTPRP